GSIDPGPVGGYALDDWLSTRAWTRIGPPLTYSSPRSTRPRAAFAFRFAAMYFASFTQTRLNSSLSYPIVLCISPDAMKHVRHPAAGLFVTSHGRLTGESGVNSPRSAKSASTLAPGFTPSSLSG